MLGSQSCMVAELDTLTQNVSWSAELSSDLSPVKALAMRVNSLGRPETHRYSNGVQIQLCDSMPFDSPTEPKPTLLLFAEMGCGLEGADNASGLYRLAMIRDQFPDRRVIILGSPDGSANGTRLDSKAARSRVAHGDFRPLLEPLCEYLAQASLQDIDVAGVSGGAETMTHLLDMLPPDNDYGLHVNNFLALEAPGTHKRSVVALGLRFLHTTTSVQHYVRDADPAYKLALHIQKPLHKYIGSMIFNKSNFAIARGFAPAHYHGNIRRAIHRDPTLRGVVAHAASTEFGPRRHVEHLARELAREFHGRVRFESLGQNRHAVCRKPELAAGLARLALQPEVV